MPFNDGDLHGAARTIINANESKLAGIEAGADVTDTANVTAAGALMDSEVDSDIKTLALPPSTTISAFGATIVDDANQAAAQATLGVDPAGTDNSTDIVALNTQTGAAYTLVLTDEGKIVEMNNAAANTLTIPTNASVAFPTGTLISITNFGAGVTTVTGDTGVTVNGVSAGGAAIDAQYAGLSLYKRGADEWVMQGAHGVVA